jgi:hypothetical protein
LNGQAPQQAETSCPTSLTQNEKSSALSSIAPTDKTASVRNNPVRRRAFFQRGGRHFIHLQEKAKMFNKRKTAPWPAHEFSKRLDDLLGQAQMARVGTRQIANELESKAEALRMAVAVTLPSDARLY